MTAINPLGAVVLWDGENPRTFTAKAREAISGGTLVVSSGAANVVSSGADSYSTSDIIVTPIKDGNYCNGIALQNAGSNENITVATRGVYLLRSAGAISGGVGVYPVSGTSQGVASVPISINYSGTEIGRALTAASSGNFLLVDLRV